MERIIASKDVTDTLVKALENADRMKNVVIVYETQDTCENAGGILTNKEVTMATMNYLLDLAKSWIFDQ